MMTGIQFISKQMNSGTVFSILRLNGNLKEWPQVRLLIIPEAIFCLQQVVST